MRTRNDPFTTDRRRFLGTGLKAAAATGLLAQASPAQTPTTTTTITGTLVNVVSPGVTEISQVTLSTNTDPNTQPGEFDDDVIYTGSIKFVSDGETMALKYTIDQAVANALDAFPPDPVASPNNFVFAYNGITNWDEHNSLVSMTIDNSGTSGQITSSMGSTFTFMIVQGGAAMRARTRPRAIRVASAQADPIQVIVAWIGLACFVICAAVALVKALIDNCVKEAATTCGNKGVKSVETDITVGISFKSGFKVGCTSECKIVCNESS